MTGEQLQAWLTAHKTEVLGGAAAAVAALALYSRKKTAAGAAGSPAGGASATPVTYTPQQLPAGYDSSAVDVYNALEGQLQQLTASQAAPVSKPVASTLFQPTYDGNYVQFADGTSAEVESDGSLLWLLPDQGKQAMAQQGAKLQQLPVSTQGLSIYNTAGNLQAANKTKTGS